MDEKRAYQIDLRVYASINSLEIPFMLPERMTDKNGKVKPGYHSPIFTLTEKEITEIYEWAGEYPDDIKLLGITPLN